eukprot:Platyproteum_vivax@DN851_c0_g1_i1.p1
MIINQLTVVLKAYHLIATLQSEKEKSQSFQEMDQIIAKIKDAELKKLGANVWKNLKKKKGEAESLEDLLKKDKEVREFFEAGEQDYFTATEQITIENEEKQEDLEKNYGTFTERKKKAKKRKKKAKCTIC